MRQYAGTGAFEFSEISLDKTSTLRIDIEEITGKIGDDGNNFQENDS